MSSSAMMPSWLNFQNQVMMLMFLVSLILFIAFNASPSFLRAYIEQLDNSSSVSKTMGLAICFFVLFVMSYIER